MLTLNCTRAQIRSQVPNRPHWDDPHKSRSTFPPARVRAGPTPLPQWIGEFYCPRKSFAVEYFHNGLAGYSAILHMLQVVGKWIYMRNCETWQVLDPGNEAFNLGIRRCRRTLRQLLPRNIFQVFRCTYPSSSRETYYRFLDAIASLVPSP